MTINHICRAPAPVPLALVCICLASCASHTARIQDGAAAVREHAGEAAANQDEIDRRLAEGGGASDVRPFTDDTRNLMGQIGDLSQTITRHSRHVMDTTPGWVRALILLGWGLMIGGAAFILVYLGIGRIIRPMMNRIGMWITPAMREQARMDSKILERGPVSAEFSRATTIRKTDPAYRKALEQETKTLRSTAGRNNSSGDTT